MPLEYNIYKINLYQLQVTKLVLFEAERKIMLASDSEYNMGTPFCTLYLLPLPFFVLDQLLSSKITAISSHFFAIFCLGNYFHSRTNHGS